VRSYLGSQVDPALRIPKASLRLDVGRLTGVPPVVMRPPLALKSSLKGRGILFPDSDGSARIVLGRGFLGTSSCSPLVLSGDQLVPTPVRPSSVRCRAREVSRWSEIDLV
jgi:hypothetical protein